MSNEEQTAWLITAVESNGDDKSVKLSLFGYPSDGLRATLRLYAGRRITVKLVAFPAQPSGVVVDKNGHALTAETEAARAEGFAAGLTRARDLLAAHADEAEALARGQATEAEQAQTRAAASATRAAVQRGGVALLDREIAALKGEGK